MPAGRPKTQLSDLVEGWKDGVLELASQGASDVEIIDFLDISKTLFYRLLEDEQEFSDTIKAAHVKCQLWWEKKARLNLESKEFNSTLWYMNMKNRFGWCDKNENKTDITSGGQKMAAIELIVVDPKKQ